MISGQVTNTLDEGRDYLFVEINWDLQKELGSHAQKPETLR